MSDKAIILNSTLDDIGNAIIEKGGSIASMLPSEMPDCIRAIKTSESGWVKQPWRNDGNQHIWIRIDTEFLSYNQPIQANLTIQSSTGGEIDYGDGTIAQYASNTKLTVIDISHYYTRPGDYEIIVSGVDMLNFSGGSTYINERYLVRSSVIRQIELCKLNPQSGSDQTRSFALLENLEYVKFDDDHVNLSRWYTFEKCLHLKSVEGNATIVGNNVFYDCYTMRDQVELSACKSIGNYAFCGCANIYEIGDLPEMTSIGNYAFDGCVNIRSIGDLSSCKSISQSTFNCCSKLSSIGNIDACESIGRAAFSDCYELKNIGLTNKCTFIDEYAFKSNYALTHVGDLTNVSVIVKNAFLNCSSLLSIGDMPHCLSIGEYAFQNCSSLTSVGTLSNCTTIAAFAFNHCDLHGSVITDINQLNNSSFSGCSAITDLRFGNIGANSGEARNGALNGIGTGNVFDDEGYACVVTAKCPAKNMVNPDYDAKETFPYKAGIKTKFVFTDATVIYDTSARRWACHYASYSDFPQITLFKCDCFFVDDFTGNKYRWNDTDKRYYTV